MKHQLVLIVMAFVCLRGGAQVAAVKSQGAFEIAAAGRAASIYVDAQDFPLVQRSAALLADDIYKVCGVKPAVLHTIPSNASNLIIIGSVERSAGVKQLIATKKLDAPRLTNTWEAYVQFIMQNPLPGIARSLVIAGSDRRGVAYGVFDLSRQMGVSPWYWWADVPVNKLKQLYLPARSLTSGAPKVKYRGIFINDEAPALAGWSKEKFGGFNHLFYEKVFELMLRLKANYLWPAMWGNAFYDDDSLNRETADEYGIVIGTSHHEPLMRAHDEWRRYGKGKWNYDSNETNLKSFWREGIRRAGNTEKIISVGMRGDGDEPMTEGTAIALLERIVKDQRTIIEEVSGKPAAESPQLWALYKEVQDYYDKGMRVPDDVTLLLCDDNWGNIRKLPKLGEKARKGGYGIYYHFDYVGGPRNYKWVNTNPIPRVWEQMHLAWEYGAREIWIVNVGDIKPMEFPTSFFLDYAWDPESIQAKHLQPYTEQWAAQQFGKQHAKDIGRILATYAKYNARRKPELLSPQTYSLLHYKEAETVVADYKKLEAEAEQIGKMLPAAYQDAYFQLVLHPVSACANLNELYLTVGLNRMYAEQGRAGTNELAAKAKQLFERDSAISHQYNKGIANGKWDHMMDQTHISYTYWQQPAKDVLPEVKQLPLPQLASMGVAIEGSNAWWPQEKAEAVLPVLDVFMQQQYYIDVFNRGQTPFGFTVKSGQPWLRISKSKGNVSTQERLWVSVDWRDVPSGLHRVPVTISGNGKTITVHAQVHRPAEPSKSYKGFVQSNGVVSMEALHYTTAFPANGINWTVIPGLGRTVSGITPFPVTAPQQQPGGNAPRLEYEMYLFDTGAVKVNLYFSPTLDFHHAGGLKYGISIDDGPVQVVTANADKGNRVWEQWVAGNIIISTSAHRISKAGVHLLKFHMIDPGLVLQKIVVDAGGQKPSYLGPPETINRETIK